MLTYHIPQKRNFKEKPVEPDTQEEKKVVIKKAATKTKG